MATLSPGFGRDSISFFDSEREVKLAKAAAHLLFVFALFIFIALPSNKYNWMQEIDPSIAVPVDPSSGDRTIFTFSLLVLVVITQFILVAKSKTRVEKIVSVAFALVAISMWVLSY